MLYTSISKKDLVGALLTIYINSNSLASNYLMLGMVLSVISDVLLFYFLLSSSVFQLCTLLHLRMVQQYCDRWAATPAGGADDQYQLQCDRARGARRPKRENRSQGLLGTCCRHWCLLSGFPWQLGRVHDHGRKM